MEVKIYNQEGNESGTVELNESIFWLEFNEWLVHRALMYQLSNSRFSLAHSKTRWERRGSTRKIYKQKWTWRARMWSNRSPIRKKWWLAFWPRNTTNYTISMNKKERRLALFSLLSLKLKNNNILIIEDIILSEMKTRLMDNVFKSLAYEKNILFALPKDRDVLVKASSNLPYVKNLFVDYLNIKDLLKYNTLVILKESINSLNSLVK